MDNRIKFPVSEIDFATDVGLTGQDHDNYAEPGTAPRYDWMRSIILGLLANQSSSDDPIEHRPGTLHYSLDDFAYECSDGSEFAEVSKRIKIIAQSLYDWSDITTEKIGYFISSGSFSGVVRNSSRSIGIPKNLQSISRLPNKPYVFRNGKLIDPSLTNFNNDGCPVSVLLEETDLNDGDTFTVFIRPSTPPTHLTI